MKDHKISHTGEPAGAQNLSGTNSLRRILVVNGDMGIRASSAEVLIRHETDFWLKNIFIERKQNQAANAASEC